MLYFCVQFPVFFAFPHGEKKIFFTFGHLNPVLSTLTGKFCQKSRNLTGKVLILMHSKQFKFI